MMEVGVSDEALVNKEKLFSTCFFCVFGLLDKPFYRNDGCILFHRNQALIIVVAKQMDNTLFQSFGVDVIHLIAIVVQAEKLDWMSDSNALKLIYDVSCFDRIAFSEIPACRNVIKQVFDGYTGVVRQCFGALIDDF